MLQNGLFQELKWHYFNFNFINIINSHAIIYSQKEICINSNGIKILNRSIKLVLIKNIFKRIFRIFKYHRFFTIFLDLKNYFDLLNILFSFKFIPLTNLFYILLL